MRRLLIAVWAVFFATLLFATVGCASPPQAQSWGQGYEGQSGYMEPEHSYFYYWMLYHSTLGFYQPTTVYHVYVPPPGYPATYRRWQSNDYYRAPNGQFTRKPDPPRPAPGATPARTAGGFSTPKPVAKDGRTTGGFAPKPTPAAPVSRTSGGFSKPSSSSSSSPRSSGGFSSSKRR